MMMTQAMIIEKIYQLPEGLRMMGMTYTNYYGSCAAGGFSQTDLRSAHGSASSAQVLPSVPPALLPRLDHQHGRVGFWWVGFFPNSASTLMWFHLLLSGVAERERVESGRADMALVRLVRLRKEFKIGKKKVQGKWVAQPNKVAVADFSLSIDGKGCFALLGPNGAGKTTTLEMLTGDISPTSGDAYVAGFSVRTHIMEIFKLLGYCPQFGGLFPRGLSLRMHLQVFARLKGVPEKLLDEHCDRTISRRKKAPLRNAEHCPGTGGGQPRMGAASQVRGRSPRMAAILGRVGVLGWLGPSGLPSPSWDGSGHPVTRGILGRGLPVPGRALELFSHSRPSEAPPLCGCGTRSRPSRVGAVRGKIHTGPSTYGAVSHSRSRVSRSVGFS